MKVAWETQKIFGDTSPDISCTAVRIPTFRAHAEALTIETVKPVTVAEARYVTFVPLFAWSALSLSRRIITVKTPKTDDKN
jgi:aspartate-semialdehyde dehydrogenase